MDLQELKTRLARLIADTPATTGLCVQIEDDAPLIMHNAEMRFSAASLIKLPIAIRIPQEVPERRAFIPVRVSAAKGALGGRLRGPQGCRAGL